MATSSIYELLPAFKERNRVVFMLLGLLSLHQDWMELLEGQASEKHLASMGKYPETPDEVTVDEAVRGFLYFLLGTVSFSSNLSVALENARMTTSLPQDRKTPAWEDTQDLLR